MDGCSQRAPRRPARAAPRVACCLRGAVSYPCSTIGQGLWVPNVAGGAGADNCRTRHVIAALASSGLVGWGASTSGPPPEVVPGGDGVGSLTCGSFAPVGTARARCTPLPAGSAWTHCVPAGCGPVRSPTLRCSVLHTTRRFDGSHSPGGRCSRLGGEDRAWPPVGASTPTSPPAMVARIVVNESGTGVPL